MCSIKTYIEDMADDRNPNGVGKDFEITEREYEALKERGLVWRKFDSYESYLDEDEDELMEYLCIIPEKTGLSMKIYVDDGWAYKRHDHPIWLYIRNGYSSDAPILPVIVSDEPCIPLRRFRLEVSEQDLEMVYGFILGNYANLVRLACDRIINVDFLKVVRDGRK